MKLSWPPSWIPQKLKIWNYDHNFYSSSLGQVFPEVLRQSHDWLELLPPIVGGWNRSEKYCKICHGPAAALYFFGFLREQIYLQTYETAQPHCLVIWNIEAKFVLKIPHFKFFWILLNYNCSMWVELQLWRVETSCAKKNTNGWTLLNTYLS